MEKIHSEVKKKNDEIEYYRKELQERNNGAEPVAPPRRTSIMPAELDDDQKVQEVKANKKAVMEEMLEFRRKNMSGIDRTD